MRSTSMPSSPANAIATSVPQTPAKSGASFPPNPVMANSPTNAAIMKTSLCAKLMSFKMP